MGKLKLKQSPGKVEEIGQGRKFDGGKLRYELIPHELLEALAKALTYGANKYEDNNWQKVEQKRYIGASFRHLVAWIKGETHDSESGLHHLVHLLANVGFMLWQDIHTKQLDMGEVTNFKK